MNTRPAPSFELIFRPNVRLINLVRHFVSEFYGGIVQDRDTASRLALATHELLENAVKYSIDGETSLNVEVDPISGHVAVRVRNRATVARIAALKIAFDEIASATDAGSLYAEAIRRSATREAGSGGLGLARIWAESELSLQLVVENDEVEIRAQGRVGSDEGGAALA